MGRPLVIVESPAKARTISRYLGRRYTVRASMGHVRDLPKSQLGVDVEAGFEPKYINIRGKGPIIRELREAARKAGRVYLATDPDREGEAISWHLAELLDLEADSRCRIEFHEITPEAVRRSLEVPRPLNRNLVDAQQARRVLDRLVGYKLSPLLWAKVRRGLSAGRVQSVAVRLITDREREIEEFRPEEYWSVTAHLAKLEAANGAAGPVALRTFPAKLIRRRKEKIELKSGADAAAVVEAVTGQPFRVVRVDRSQRRRNPPPPFITSTLQQEASRKLGFSPARTMQLAQQLYEGLDVGDEGAVGLITYMRTDATRVSAAAQQEARAYIEEAWGEEYRPPRPPQYRSRAGAQGAHEAIRPTAIAREPERVKPFLKRDQYRLYRLIWERFLASQMSPAVYDTLTVDVEAAGYLFRATGSRLVFPGFMVVYLEGDDEGHPSQPPAQDTARVSLLDHPSAVAPEGEERELPPLAEGELLELVKLEPQQHFTQPPPRYTEAMLVRAMEERGIGRPSTYAPTIDTIKKRGYVRLEERRFRPTELGRVVVDLLKEHFPNVIDIEFTARMEEALDQVEAGLVPWETVVRQFYDPFAEQLRQAQAEIERIELAEPETGESCERCGRKLVLKQGRFGPFLACPGFPECRFTKPYLVEIGVTCPECGGALVERRTRRGRLFYGCRNYPSCTFTSWNRPVGRRCPRCGGLLVEKGGAGGRRVVCPAKGCSYQERRQEQPEVVSLGPAGEAREG